MRFVASARLRYLVKLGRTSAMTLLQATIITTTLQDSRWTPLCCSPHVRANLTSQWTQRRSVLRPINTSVCFASGAQSPRSKGRSAIYQSRQLHCHAAAEEASGSTVPFDQTEAAPRSASSSIESVVDVNVDDDVDFESRYEEGSLVYH